MVQELQELDKEGKPVSFVVPSYIKDAIEHVAGQVKVPEPKKVKA